MVACQDEGRRLTSFCHGELYEVPRPDIRWWPASREMCILMPRYTGKRQDPWPLWELRISTSPVHSSESA